MDFINQSVTHKRFGEGKVISCDGKTVTVSFEGSGERSFIYPDAFQNFLEADDPVISDEIALDIEKKQLETEETARKAAEDRAEVAAALIAANSAKKVSSRSAKKPTVNLAIKPSKPSKPKSAPKPKATKSKTKAASGSTAAQ